MEEVFENMERIGVLTGKASIAQDLTLCLRRRVEEVERKADTITCGASLRVLRVISYRPLMVAGTDSVQYDAIAVAVGRNIPLPNLALFPSMTLEDLKEYDIKN